MRIAQVAPLYESVPPYGYGGTERVVSYLTEALVRRGHEVTLFASADSITAAELVSIGRKSIRLHGPCQDAVALHLCLLEEVFRCRERFDLIHFHTDYLHFPMLRREAVPSITTLHGRLDISELVPLYREYTDIPLVSISNHQRLPLAWANWQGTVYHGLPASLYEASEALGTYLVFLGRVSPEKGLDSAIAIAERSGMPLKIAAKIDAVDREYFEFVIKPLLGRREIEFIGEVNEREKNDLLKNAYALLFPIDWPEPFGLAMIEAMACGTPVIAFRRGSVPEVIGEGKSGFIVDTVDDGVAALAQVPAISRRGCRRYFEERFTDAQMAHRYEVIYDQLIQ